MEQTSDQKPQGSKAMQVENNKREITITLRNVHWSTPVIQKYETKLVRDQGYFISSKSMGIKLLQHYPHNNFTRVKNSMARMRHECEKLVEVVS